MGRKEKGGKGKGGKEDKGQQANPERNAFKTVTDAADEHSVLLTKHLELKKKIKKKEQYKQNIVSMADVKAASLPLFKLQCDNALTAVSILKVDDDLTDVQQRVSDDKEVKLEALKQQLKGIEVNILKLRKAEELRELKDKLSDLELEMAKLKDEIKLKEAELVVLNQ